MSNEENTVETEESLAVQEAQLVRIHGEIFLELLKFGRFKQFVAANYDVNTITDEEANTMRLEVVELTAQEVQVRILKTVEELKKQQPELVTASEADLKKIKGASQSKPSIIV